MFWYRIFFEKYLPFDLVSKIGKCFRNVLNVRFPKTLGNIKNIETTEKSTRYRNNYENQYFLKDFHNFPKDFP